MKRNLIYYIYLKDCPALWLNLDLMDKYIHLFDGQIIIKMAGVVDNINIIGQKYPWILNAELVPNYPTHEAPHFKQALTELDLTEPSMTFYAHAKGVSRPWNKALERWIRLMYKGNLDHVPDLGNKLFSGCFGKLRRGSDQVPVPWHYSGTFYWMSTVRVVNRYYFYEKFGIPQDVDNRWFTENFPGLIATQKEVLFNIHASDEKGYNLYSDKFWLKHPELCKLVN
jgi:hypothetical protein